MHARFALVALFVALFSDGMISMSAHAQSCGGRWLPGDPASGVDGTVNVMARWDPDGAGPKGPQVLLGGAFTFPGSGLAAWDPETGLWSAPGPILDGPVVDLITRADGSIVIAGSFTLVNGISVGRVARWEPDTQTWRGYGRGVNGSVQTITQLPDGDLVIGGGFNLIFEGLQSAAHIARWDAQTALWTPMSPGFNAAVRALVTLPNGDVVAGGAFSPDPFYSTNHVARWNRETDSWSSLGGGVDADVSCLVVLPDGDVVAGGVFQTAGGVSANRVARWDAQTNTWSAMGSGLIGDVSTLTALPNGDVIAGGIITSAGGVSVNNLALWHSESNTWSSFTSGTGDRVYAVEVLDGGDVMAGGTFTTAGPVTVSRVARWRLAGEIWEPLGCGFDGLIESLAVLPDGNLVVGGRFSSVSGIRAMRIARWDVGTNTWANMSNGIDPSRTVNAAGIAVGPDGLLVAACNRTTSPQGIVMRWSNVDGTWTQYGDRVNMFWYSMAVLPDGDVICGGSRYHTSLSGVERLDSSTVDWSTVGSVLPITAYSLLILPNEDIVAGTNGGFPDALGSIIRYSAADEAWTSLGGGVAGNAPRVLSVAAFPDGDVLAAGSFTSAGGLQASNIARWDAETDSWSAYGSGTNAKVSTVAALANGDALAGGAFTSCGDVVANHVARWSFGSGSWSALGSGVDGDVLAVKMLANRQVAMGGNFRTAGGHPSAAFARYQFFDAPPAITNQPLPTLAYEGETLELSVTVEPDFEGVVAQWYRNGVAIIDGPAGAAADGGVVSGATRTFATPTETTPITLAISGAKSEDQGEYSVTFTNACGTSTSESVSVRICPACPADFDQDGGVTVDDVGAFFSDYEQEAACADVDRDGGFTAADVAAFFGAFEAGGC